MGRTRLPAHLLARQPAATNAESLEAENARLRALTTTLLEWKVCTRHADQVSVATARDRQWQRNNEFPWLGWQLCEGCLHDDLAAFISGNHEATTLATKLKEARDGALTAALELSRLRERVAVLEAACYQEIPDDVMPTMSGFVCLLCQWDCSPEFLDEHAPSCVLYVASLAEQPAAGGAE